MRRPLLAVTVSGLVAFGTGGLQADSRQPGKRVEVEVKPPGAERPRVAAREGAA